MDRKRLLTPAVAQPLSARLVFVVAGKVARIRTLHHPGAVLGRSEDAEIVIDQPDVSRRHARIDHDPQSGWVIQDLDSRNGTFVNGSAVTRCKLSFGDRIELGCRTLMLFGQHDQLEERLLQLQKMEALGLLAGGLAHDFNNQLSVISTNIEFLARQLPGAPDDEDSHASIADIRLAIEQASDLVGRLMNFARQEGPLAAEDVSLAELVTEVVGLCRPMLPEQATIESLLHDTPLVLGDRGQLHQMLMNLCINARDALGRGGRIEVSLGQGCPDSASPSRAALLSPQQEWVELSVRDDGCGMEEQVRRRIFEPLFTTKRATKGTGIGLSTVYGIVRRHGGDIVVESAPGEGSTFTVLLPVYVPGDPKREDTTLPETDLEGETTAVKGPRPTRRF